MCLFVTTAVYVLVYTTTLARCVQAENDTKPVYFSLIFSGGQNGGYNSSGGIPALHFALKAVRDNQLLPGYNLTYETARNSKV